MTVHDPILAAAQRARAAIPDDTAMLRAAAELTRDYSVANPRIYWPDMLGSAVIGWVAMVGAIVTENVAIAVACGVVAMLALYRAASFIHELTHIRKGALPGFRFGWNLIVGIPLMIPSFLYEGVHTQHHARTRYGTAEDPEYLPLALMKPWSLPLFILVASLAPVGLILRFGLLTPLSLILPPLRRKVVAELSALSINPAYRRRAPEGAFARMWAWQEAGACLFALALVGSVFLFGWKPLLVYMAIHSAMTVINQLRTLVAHLWENEGDPMTVTAQYLDSVNVPPPGALPELWAPVGLRYHALHHLLPSVPYHALGQAHARLIATLDAGSPYHRGNYPGMVPLVGKIARSTMGAR
ncbi:fatty acid desaturase family protein [Sphingobium sp. Ant17]|jgi:fatty acid desaturase|uniref:fatty acid desaturase family protein n=1 Tax=Sphingobium sp. Ant17 TaxID=1461752 RepID=UPI0004504652|nr:fatty acid desaturase [Sphingobium sp. Ant17]EXS71591.1 fatty acid desaturase [Sphingobium sp. Ant17]OHC91547.1 MAG: fatty acid desaturase [Sphingomonadales bacterium GWF1_63_6]